MWTLKFSKFKISQQKLRNNWELRQVGIAYIWIKTDFSQLNNVNVSQLSKDILGANERPQLYAPSDHCLLERPAYIEKCTYKYFSLFIVPYFW